MVGELNGQHVKLVKFKGEFVWHQRDDEDEMFYVLKRAIKNEVGDKTVEIKENEFLVVQKVFKH